MYTGQQSLTSSGEWCAFRSWSPQSRLSKFSPPGFMLVNFQIDVSLIRPPASQYSDCVPSRPTYSLKRWQLENKTRRLLYVLCGLRGTVPKEKRNPMYYSLQKSAEMWSAACMCFLFLLIPYHRRALWLRVNLQQRVKVSVWSDVMFSSRCSSSGVLHSHCSIEASPHTPQLSATFIWKLCIFHLLLHKKKKK